MAVMAAQPQQPRVSANFYHLWTQKCLKYKTPEKSRKEKNIYESNENVLPIASSYRKNSLWIEWMKGWKYWMFSCVLTKLKVEERKIEI